MHRPILFSTNLTNLTNLTKPKTMKINLEQRYVMKQRNEIFWC